jgi:hypothetical protein
MKNGPPQLKPLRPAPAATASQNLLFKTKVKGSIEIYLQPETAAAPGEVDWVSGKHYHFSRTHHSDFNLMPGV